MSFKTKAGAICHCGAVCEILGENWEGRVWENIGWHVAWQNGAVTLYFSARDDLYNCLIGEPGGCGDHMDFATDTDSHSDPKTAIMAACVHAQQVIEKEWKPIEFSIAKVILSL